MNKLITAGLALVIALFAASSVLSVVDQRQFGVVYALGQIKRVVTEPGLYVKLPPPFQHHAVNLWGQTREAWRTNRQRLR